MRNRFRVVSTLWRELGPDEQQKWNDVADRANLRISGHNLFFYYTLTEDRGALLTLQRNTGIDLGIN